MNGRVLVLNAGYEPINVCSARRAAVLLLKGRAEMVEPADETLHAERLTLRLPAVLRLTSYVRVPREAGRRRTSRRAVLARDDWRCQYCGCRYDGARSERLTVDHVIPRSRGGSSNWDNIVAACATCNRKKADRLPRDAKMAPRNRPKAPSPMVFIRIATPRVPLCWEPYLATSG